MTLAPQPQTIANDVLKQLNALKAAANHLTDFQSRKLKQEIKKLKDVDVSGMWLLLGMLAALEGDEVEMRHCHDNAITNSNGKLEALLNYGVSLGMMGYFEEALVKFRTAYNNNQEDLVVVDALIDGCLNTGRFEEANLWVEEWKKLNPDSNHRLTYFISRVNNYINDNNLNEKNIIKILDTSISVLRENNIYASDVTLDIKDDEDSEWLSWLCQIKAPVEKRIKLSVDFADKIARSNIDSSLFNKFVIRFESKYS